MHRSRTLIALAVALVVAGSGLSAQAQTPAGAAGRAPARADGEVPLTAELMYRLLVGDVAMQRGEVVVAARAYLDAATDTGSATLARRATEVALASRQRPLALEAARLWARLDPKAERAQQLVVALSSPSAARQFDDLASERPDREKIERALAEAAKSPEVLGAAFLELNRLLAHESDRKAQFQLVTELAAPYPKVAEAHFAVAVAGYSTGLADREVAAAALAAVDRALELRPGWDRAVALKAELLGRQSVDAAIEFLKAQVRLDPSSRTISATLAQFLVGQKRYAEAKAVFSELWSKDRTNRDSQFALAALAFETKDWAEAEALFDDLKRAGWGDTGVVETYLAQIAEETGRYELAFERYRSVPDSERGWLGRLRAAAMLGKLKRVDDARRFLAELPAVTLEQRVQVRQAEAQLLRDANDNAGAYALLEGALAEHPGNPDLLYDLAMVAEKLDRLDVVEAKLRQVIEMKPDSPHALNSLGYTLVDRTARFAEGFALIERAHKLAPGDGFILDSMGWALFRLGRLDEAESYLRRAMDARPDAEIAAHLGEVLWTKGDRDGARELWRSHLKAHPDNVVLQETVRRLDR